MFIQCAAGPGFPPEPAGRQLCPLFLRRRYTANTAAAAAEDDNRDAHDNPDNRMAGRLAHGLLCGGGIFPRTGGHRGSARRRYVRGSRFRLRRRFRGGLRRRRGNRRLDRRPLGGSRVGGLGGGFGGRLGFVGGLHIRIAAQHPLHRIKDGLRLADGPVPRTGDKAESASLASIF